VATATTPMLTTSPVEGPIWPEEAGAHPVGEVAPQSRKELRAAKQMIPLRRRIGLS